MNTPGNQNDWSKWHWAEGNKYALEALKTMLVLNSGAAIALLTILGSKTRTKLDYSETISFSRSALVSFAFGAFMIVLAFTSAYFTQLYYGNGNQAFAWRCHYATYAFLIASILGFIFGLCFFWQAITAYLL
ncbi:MAG: hypothetical protein EPO23_07800 [Xanthobacteraceae bacterium]|nr:MAG: hypothetical protein EPO23_07800 [Xanthobacteraceae bacterium]